MTTEVPPPAGRGKVPVWRTAIGSYGFVLWQSGSVLCARLASPRDYLRGEYGERLPDRSGRRGKPFLGRLGDLYRAFRRLLGHVPRLRRSLAPVFLLGERESVFTDVLGTRNWRFLGYTVLLTFAPIVPMFVIGFVSFGVFVSVVETQGAGAVELALILLFGLSGIAMFILLFVMFRFYLVLPGTAVDRPLTLGEAWRNMRGNSWRFIGAFFFVSIPLIIAALILATFGGISEFASATGGASEPTIGVLVVTNALMAIIGFFVMAVGVTVLSKFYRHIVGMDAPGGGAHVLAEGP